MDFLCQQVGSDGCEGQQQGGKMAEDDLELLLEILKTQELQKMKPGTRSGCIQVITG